MFAVEFSCLVTCKLDTLMTNYKLIPNKNNSKNGDNVHNNKQHFLAKCLYSNIRKAASYFSLS